MRVLRVKNINDALPMGLWLLNDSHIEITPREAAGGRTWECPEPVTTVYLSPLQRVLFSPKRNKNHFFELFETLWILAGRRDSAFLEHFNKQMGEYAEGGKYHGAYGYRLRHHFNFDQIVELVTLLKEEPDTRRAVLQIWDTKRDLNNNTSKDLPCNDILFFKLRDGILNLTVANRSNDIIWGAYGTNAVQFSMILEYVAAALNVRVGTYRQVSDSYHLYPDNPIYERVKSLSVVTAIDPYLEREAAYTFSMGRLNEIVTHTPLLSPLGLEVSPELHTWNSDLNWFFQCWDDKEPLVRSLFHTNYFRNIVVPMFNAWKKRDVRELQHMPENSDWRLGGEIWFRIRQEKLGDLKTD